MNRIDTLFNSGKSRVLSVYFTAGYPDIADTVKIISLLERNGADMVEIGIPYSDPLADGRVIQETGNMAIANGMTIRDLFIQLETVRGTISIPLLLMSYLNPVLQFGFNEFCRNAEKAGIDGLIIPDLPPYEFRSYYKAITDQHNLKNVFLVTPETPDQRIRELDNLSSGFLYLVSTASTTGKTGAFNESSLSYFRRIASMRLKNPTMVGFGIYDHITLEQVFSCGHGAIIGSAYLRALGSGGSVEEATTGFFKAIKNRI
jgi:tryptophan synthase alpha chain